VDATRWHWANEKLGSQGWFGLRKEKIQKAIELIQGAGLVAKSSNK
jgi:hypothetical protein